MSLWTNNRLHSYFQFQISFTSLDEIRIRIASIMQYYERRYLASQYRLRDAIDQIFYFHSPVFTYHRILLIDCFGQHILRLFLVPKFLVPTVPSSYSVYYILSFMALLHQRINHEILSCPETKRDETDILLLNASISSTASHKRHFAYCDARYSFL